MNEQPIIILIQLGPTQSEQPTVACELELNGVAMTFYNGIDKHMEWQQFCLKKCCHSKMNLKEGCFRV